LWVLAVNERRSPADSTKGKAGSGAGGGAVASRASSLSTSGTCRFTVPLRARMRRQTLSCVSTAKMRPERQASLAQDDQSFVNPFIFA
jgi:hypothetical protein